MVYFPTTLLCMSVTVTKNVREREREREGEEIPLSKNVFSKPQINTETPLNKRGSPFSLSLYAAFQEANMDPNETTQRLFNQGLLSFSILLCFWVCFG